VGGGWIRGGNTPVIYERPGNFVLIVNGRRRVLSERGVG